MGLMDKMKAASQNAMNAVAPGPAPQPAPGYGPPPGYGAPAPAPQAARPALEYDEDGELEHCWDTNALEHGPWTVEEFESALVDLMRKECPDEMHDPEQIAMFRAEHYKYWKYDGGWEMRQNAQMRVQVASGGAQDNPVLQPIQGVTLSDYTQINLKMAEAADLSTVLGAMGIDPVVWAEASQGWVDRMSSDLTYVVSTEFGRLYQLGITDPRLTGVSGAIQTTNPANLERLRSDRTFVQELSGGRTAAYNAGLDGNAWMMDTFGVSPTDFQQAENGWGQEYQQLTERYAAGDMAAYQQLSAESNTDEGVRQWTDLSRRAAAGDTAARQYIRDNLRSTPVTSASVYYWDLVREAFEKAYAQKFTTQMGGGAADDISF